MIDCRIDDRVAVLTLNNQPANTFTAEGLLQLQKLVGELNGNPEVYAAVITGQGEKFFCAGAELRTFAEGDKEKARLMEEGLGLGHP